LAEIQTFIPRAPHAFPVGLPDAAAITTGGRGELEATINKNKNKKATQRE
jgi:hypothetical protein